MDLADLVTIHEITQLKYRYVRAVDTQDWNLLRSCFAEDSRVWYDGGAHSCSGRETIATTLASMMKPSIYSSHIALHPEITVTGPATAKGVWRFEDMVHFTEADPTLKVQGLEGGEELNGAGYYHDEYVKENGQWKIKSTGYVRLFESIEKAKGRTGFHVRIEKARGKLEKV